MTDFHRPPAGRDGERPLPVPGEAHALAVNAGRKVSAYLARAYLPALPMLSVHHSSKQVTISWPTVDTAGFALEQAGPLTAPAGWVPNSAPVTDDGATKSVTLPAADSPQFFRLRRP